MKKQDISRMLTDIDEKYIEEASQIKRSPSLWRYGGLAACLAAVIAVAVFTVGRDFSREVLYNGETEPFQQGAASGTTLPAANGEIAVPPTREDITEEMGEIPHWDDIPFFAGFGEVTYEGVTYHTSATELPSENIGSRLGEAVMRGYDIYKDEQHTARGELYSVRGISTDCAIGVKIGDEEGYYAYVNSYYEPETLGQLMQDINMKSTVSFGQAYITEYEFYETGSRRTERCYEDFDDSIILGLLEDCSEAKNQEYIGVAEGIGISVDIPLLGYKNISLVFTQDGYAVTNILSTRKCFFVGEERVADLEGYITRELSFTERTYNTVYGTPGETQDNDSQSTPPYIPETATAVTRQEVFPE